MQIETEMYIGDEDELVTVWGDFTPADCGRRDRYGVPLEPDYPPSLTYGGAEDADGRPIELSTEDEERAVRELWYEVERRIS